MPTALFTVKATITPDREKAFNEWYNREHAPDRVLGIPGFIQVRRFVAVEGAPQNLRPQKRRRLHAPLEDDDALAAARQQSREHRTADSAPGNDNIRFHRRKINSFALKSDCAKSRQAF